MGNSERGPLKLTGTVLRVNAKAGFIKTDQGPVLFFRRSSVLDPGFDALDVGQPVTFEMDRENRRIAVDVLRHFEWGLDNPPLESGAKSPHLRYLGYEQEADVRTYHFSAVPKGGRLLTFSIDASIELLTKHHVRIQDAAALCVRALESELTPEDWIAGNPKRHVLKLHHLDL
jgi:cold shock CspA family protein